ncbi:MAG: hypothetical protein CEN87_73 [Parcubacteria group bacterium Licking1014_1]|nr:MAG: hypothetical protein CEN87_73 [Parcubacteria group bacterium Licking1014_1]
MMMTFCWSALNYRDKKFSFVDTIVDSRENFNMTKQQ